MRELLTDRRFAFVWWAGLTSQLGSWLLSTALPMHVFQMTGSAAATSLLLIAGAVPRVLLGGVAGVYVDRWNRRRTMLVTNVLLALVALPLLVPGWGSALLVVCAVAAAKSVLAQFFGPAEDALLPTLVSRENLTTANALNALNNNLARFIGPALGGVLVAVAGLPGVVACAAAVYLVAAVLMTLVKVPKRVVRRTDEGPPRFAASFRAGWSHVRSHRVLMVLLVFMAVTAIGEGVFGTLLAPFVAVVFAGGTLEYGWIVSAQAVGGIVAGAVVAWLANRFEPVSMLGVGCLLLGIGDLITINYPAVYPHIWPALVLMAIVGLPAVAIRTGYLTLLQTAAGDEFVGRVSGLMGTVAAAFSLIGMVLAGTLADRLGVVAVLQVQPAVYLLAGALVLLALRGVTSRGTNRVTSRGENEVRTRQR